MSCSDVCVRVQSDVEGPYSTTIRACCDSASMIVPVRQVRDGTVRIFTERLKVYKKAKQTAHARLNNKPPKMQKLNCQSALRIFKAMAVSHGQFSKLPGICTDLMYLIKSKQ